MNPQEFMQFIQEFPEVVPYLEEDEGLMMEKIINLTKSPLAVPVEEDTDGEERPITRDEKDIDYKEFTMTELREYLDLLKIEYPAKARRYELLKILEEAKQ